MIARIVFSVLVSFLFLNPIVGQLDIETGSDIIVKMNDGNRYQGKLKAQADNTIVLMAEDLGEIILQKHKIRKVIPIQTENDHTYLYQNPNATRYLFAPSGYGLKKGEGYYHNFMAIYNSASYGITSNITIGLGIAPIVIDDFIPLTITPKVSIPVFEEKFNVGVGAIYARLNGEDLGVAYGVGTLGSRNKNVSIGMGWGLVNDEWSKRPLITVSGTWRLSKKWGFVTENWLIPSYDYQDGRRVNSYLPIVSYSARFIGEVLSIDMGFINQKDIAEVFPLGVPVVGVVFPFGKPYRYRKTNW